MKKYMKPAIQMMVIEAQPIMQASLKGTLDDKNKGGFIMRGRRHDDFFDELEEEDDDNIW